jgi:hypothetical protein
MVGSVTRGAATAGLAGHRRPPYLPAPGLPTVGVATPAGRLRRSRAPWPRRPACPPSATPPRPPSASRQAGSSPAPMASAPATRPRRPAGPRRRPVRPRGHRRAAAAGSRQPSRPQASARPTALFDELAVLAGTGPGCRVLEIGCGTGQATVPLAERGLRDRRGGAGRRLPTAAQVPHGSQELERSSWFDPAVFRRWEWELSYPTAAYLEVLDTYSGHRALAPAARQGLWAASPGSSTAATAGGSPSVT